MYFGATLGGVQLRKRSGSVKPMWNYHFRVTYTSARIRVTNVKCPTFICLLSLSLSIFLSCPL